MIALKKIWWLVLDSVEKQTKKQEPNGHPQVVLASMPFGSVLYPSPALGRLMGGLTEKGIGTRCKHYSLNFAETMGMKFYNIVANLEGDSILGDWIFSKAAFPDFESDDDAYLARLHFIRNRPVSRRSRDNADSFVSAVLRAKTAAGPFIDEIAGDIVRLSPRIVGCTSVFSQNCASLALLRRVREMDPSIVTIMGGANCEGVMGQALHANFPWLDYVLSGEGDVIVPALFEKILTGEEIASGRFDGLFTPSDRSARREPGRAVVSDLSSLPTPIYDDYFHDLESGGLKDAIAPGLLAESSRGCWWGEKRACAFCGLNGLARPHRSVPAGNVVREIEYLAERYGIRAFMMTDNMLPLKHIGDFLAYFNGKGFTFLYEVSPTLSRAQAEALSDAGVRWIQPGIENLHDGCLAALGKGSKAYQNVRFLKLAREYGIALVWNFLYRFPGEEDAWYGEIADLIPLITHLQPPMSPGTPVRYDRFSRYHSDPGAYGLELEVLSSYEFVYPLDREKLSRLVYFFEDKREDPLGTLSPGMALALKKLYEWRFLFPPSAFESKAAEQKPPMLGQTRLKSGGLTIRDSRPCALAPAYELSGAEAAIYEACDSGLTRKELTALGFPEEILGRILDGLIRSHLMIELSSRYLSLAVNLPCRGYPSVDSRPGGNWIRPPVKPGGMNFAEAYGVTD
jgi:magnesium-protoporphyrin IX monomethyl ester (oxidative) cyclase